MSQQAKPGRRTPLSLGPAKSDGSDKAQMRSTKVNLEKLSNELLVKNVKNGSCDEKMDDNKTENGQNNANGSSTKKEGNGVQSDILIDNSKTTDAAKQGSDKTKPNDKVSEKLVEKAKSSNEKGTSTNDKQESPNDNVIWTSKVEEKPEAKNGEKEVRESVRQKHIREEKEKEESVKEPPNSQPTKATPDKNSESSKVKEKRRPEIIASPPKTPKATPLEPLITEKPLKRLNEILQEDSMKPTDSPMSVKETKVLKFNQGAPVPALRQMRSDKLDDASLVVNLSTVSEQSVESNSNSTPVERNYSLRHITGRRSTRALREISFDFRVRESYYKTHPEFTDATSITDVASSTDSPRFRGQSKRNIDVDEAASPKRSRFDFGLLELVTSPVKKLGAKFSRTALSTSTPNKVATEDIPSGIESEHVASEDLAAFEINSVEATEKKMYIDSELPAEEAPIEIIESSKSRCVLM